MFGFLRPSCAGLAYRQAYARCCMRQHLDYGVAALPFLSYEAVFLYVLAVDAGAIPSPPESTPRCCRLRTSQSLTRQDDAAVAQFCAALGMLLSAIKIEDDLRDSSSWAARMIAWKSGAAWRAAREYFATLDAQFEGRVADIIDRHLRYERSATKTVALEQYCQPTASAFGYVFSLLAVAAPSGRGDWRALLAKLGEQIGAAIIAFDCAVDWERDRRRGEFNPLPDEPSRLRALDAAHESLLQAARACTEGYGERSLAAAILRSCAARTLEVRRRLAPRPRETAPSAGFSPLQWLTAWYDSFARRSVRLGFDCPGCDCPGCDCDCGACEGGEGGASCCECGGGKAHDASEAAGHCCCAGCDALTICDPFCYSHKRRQAKK
jgi:hypothetical protein